MEYANNPAMMISASVTASGFLYVVKKFFSALILIYISDFLFIGLKEPGSLRAQYLPIHNFLSIKFYPLEKIQVK